MDNDEKKELNSVINSGWFTEATKTRQFEKMVADFVPGQSVILEIQRKDKELRFELVVTKRPN